MNININLSKRVLKKIIKYLILFIIGCIAIFYANALSVNAYTIANNSIYVCDSSDNVITGRYNYILDGSNYTGYFGTTYQGVMTSFSTRFNATIQQGNSYTLELNSYTGDFRNISANSIQVLGGIGTHCSNNLNAYTITSVSSTYYKIIINFISNSTNNYSQLVIYNDDNSYITGITNFKIDSMTLVDNGNSGTNTIIDNQNQNKQDIIDNQNENANSIIDNQNQTTQDIIDNQNKNNEELKDTIQDGLQDCYQKNLLDKTKYVIKGSVVGLDLSLLEKGKTYTFSSNKPIEELKISESRGGVVYSGLYKYVQTTGFTEYTFTWPTDKDPSTMYLWLYLPPNDTIVSNISQLDGYNLQIEEGSSATSYVEPKEVCTNKIDETNDKLNDLNDNITSSDTSGANNEANNFFSDFEDNDFGLSDILTLPLTTIESITSKTCSPLSLTLPFVNKTFELPCMTTIYSKFEPFYSIYKTITFGIVAYWICVQIYAMVKGFKDPTSDEIEVMDL